MSNLSGIIEIEAAKNGARILKYFISNPYVTAEAAAMEFRCSIEIAREIKKIAMNEEKPGV